MDPEPRSRSTTPIVSPKHRNTAQSPITDETSTKSESTSRSSDAISSPVSDSTVESMFHSVSLAQSPSIQVMERPEDFEFEHDRILSPVFTDRCSSSLEFSSVSNESLFSIGLTNSLTFDHACLFAGDASGELLKSGDLMSFREHSSPMGGESDVDSLKVETPSKLDVPKSTLDEPQKVVRWKTQVEHHADEVPFPGHQWQPSPLPNLKSSELGNQAAAKPKKRFCWSSCDCGSCNLPKWSCWNSCWTSMNCLKGKPKKVCSSPSTEASAPTSAAPKKLDAKAPKLASKRGCCFRPRFTCSRSWSCSCHCR